MVFLYTERVDSYHKHDSNQVITSIMHVIVDVRTCRGGTLPPVLRIHADNCGRENKNQYMFALCATLVGLGYFAEVYLSFLLVGHTHEDIDQRFSVISGTLKRQDIDSLRELLELIKKGASHTKAFATSRHLEYVWDWKKFINSYLYTGPNTFVGISTKHHFKFYVKDKKPFVQTKDYARDPVWEPMEGYQCLNEVPNPAEKPSFTDVYDANEQELKALEEFIVMKEKCIMKLMYVERNLRAIEDTKWLMEYLQEFPKRDKFRAWQQLQFWPTNGEVHAHASIKRNGCDLGEPQPLLSNADTVGTGSTILDHLPPILERGYFGPRKGKPRNTTSKPAKKQRHLTKELLTMTNIDLDDPFPEFDPFRDVQVGQFVVMNSSTKDRESGIPFFLGRVSGKKNVSHTSGSMRIIWYWPKPTSQQDDPGMWTYRYRNCMKRKWIPSNEPSNWVDLETGIISWNPPSKFETCIVEKALVPKEISIPKAMTFHLLEHMANQSEAIDDACLESDKHIAEQNDTE